MHEPCMVFEDDTHSPEYEKRTRWAPRHVSTCFNAGFLSRQP